ncbi:MAG: hypothetical protein COV70_03760 [Parcubacteria group bacterium CG11_big_fil_rev_8_21_14_0_20_39_22]|nr:MAG: hypothetical protein COV70_03760 [Parcubacteria group bacterium CG11_big_fil_rev_8_21_14_0_20_39_22]
MLILIHGSDREKSRVKAHELIDTLHTKKPEAELFSIDSDKYSEPVLDELIHGQGLFEQKYVVFLDNIFENKEAKEYVSGSVKDIEESNNIFILLESSIDATTLKKLEKHASKSQIFGEKKVGKGQSSKKGASEDFNLFSMTDALGQRDKKGLWVLYQKAVMAGKVPEEINGVLFWQLKSMSVAANSESIEDSGLSPYVFNKSKRYAQNFSNDELKKLSDDMVKLYHDSRRGKSDMAIELERFILSM